MRYIPFFVLLHLAFVAHAQMRVLVFSKTLGYRHTSIREGKLALIALGQQSGFAVDTTENAEDIVSERLAEVHAVVFLSTTGNVLNSTQERALQQFVEGGGGFMGIHAAADTEYDWPWYGQMLGGYFKSHPKTQQARLVRVKPFGRALLPNPWLRTDEWYNYRGLSKKIRVLFEVDESSYVGGENGVHHPISWTNRMGKGRIFYTGMGHTPESFADENFLSHLRDGMEFVLKRKLESK